MYASHSCKNPSEWGHTPALEYWFNAYAVIEGITTEGHLLSSFGWTVTGAPPTVDGSAAGFLDVDDKGTPGSVNLDTASDVIQSPAIFGDYKHGEMAAMLAGMESADGTPDLPRFLVADQAFAFAANAAEVGTQVGFIEDGGSAAVADDAMATIATDGTNFILRSGAATSAALVAEDTAYHRWRIKVDRINALAYAYMDDMATALGSIAIQANEWPVKWGGGVVSGGTNDPLIYWARVRYAWSGWV